MNYKIGAFTTMGLCIRARVCYSDDRINKMEGIIKKKDSQIEG